MSLDYKYDLSKNIKVKIFWSKEDIIKSNLNQIIEKSKNNNNIVIWIDAKLWTENIKLIELKKNSESKILEKWIDWVIVKWLSHSTKKISLILRVADCWWICFTDKKEDIFWLIHAWYTWTAWDIIWNIFKKLDDIKDFSWYKFYIPPMMGKNFELDKNFYKKIFKNLFERYNFKYKDYIFNEYKKDLVEKVELNLRKIILDIFIKNWIKKEQIIFSKIETNSLENNWPSYRLYRNKDRIVIFLEK